jgi:anti-sigma regulatory factor (Ser/Thr protein kinase)
VRLRPGSTLVLYTDGLVERRQIALDDRLAELAAAAASGPTHDPELLTDHLLRTLLDEALRDDVAVLTMRFDPAMADRVSWQFPATTQSVPEVRGLLRRWLERGGVDADTAFDIVVACDEACANAVEHGSPNGTDVELTLEHDADGAVVVTVTDHGGWRDPRPDDEPGHGLELMEALMTRVDIASSVDGTVVRLERRWRESIAQ